MADRHSGWGGLTAEELAEEGFDSIPDAMRFIGVKRARLYQLTDSSEIPYAHVGRLRRIPRRALKVFVARAIEASTAVRP